MTARVLVVDDVPANVKLLEAKLMADYFDVIGASSGEEALSIIAKEQVDIVLLDVMMPGLDGFEVCRRIKTSPATMHLPIVLVTALDQAEDRIRGLESGADELLTKPVDDVALLARVRGLTRLKQMTDELRLRQETGQALGLLADADPGLLNVQLDTARILVADDRESECRDIKNILAQVGHLTIVSNVEDGLARVSSESFDLYIVGMQVGGADGIRFCSQVRLTDHGRHVPILIVADAESQRGLVIRAIERGVNDYIMRPIDPNELMARVRTQLRRKRYHDRLQQNFQLSLEMAVTDQLTGLYNRRYMESHLTTLVAKSIENQRPIALLILDADHFKSVNDTYGHDVGDEVLRDLGRRLASHARGIDLCCRYGGEEFVIIMPDTDARLAHLVAERLRQNVEDIPFQISTDPGFLDVTISVGIAICQGAEDTPDTILKRADQALYEAKRGGRNRVVAAA